MSQSALSEKRGRAHWLPGFLRPPLPAAPITDPSEVRHLYSYYRPRILLWSTVGYGTFYFVRKNLSVAMPLMQRQLGLSKSSLGLILTLHGLVYGVSKFLGGIAADRANARIFMALALLASAVVNVFFGLSSSLLFLGIFWAINGLFQGLGYPPCARLLTHWFSPKELATKMSIWNASHTLGGGTIVVLCGYLVTHYHSWRVCFFIPSAIAVGMAGVLLLKLRDTPESVGLPEIEGTHVPGGDSANESAAEFRQFLHRQVFSNKYIWLVSAANFFVYTIRFAVFDWGPTMLKEAKGIQLVGAGWMVAGFEVAGLGGMLVTGYLTDRVFRGRGAPLCVLCMLLCGLSVYLFWKVPGQMVWLNAALLMSAGFFVYGPQALVAVIVANLATKRAAATAVGLTSIFGYASTTLSGWGMGMLVQHYGWGPAFSCLLGIALIGALLFAAALPAKANGYGEQPV
ncbi:MAG TPA: MFS transporter [Tepidisphaeraceae bacterium]|jgi:OPA family glycerol-3-phosphate transporter-like MFS transporter/OPA family sugar phosphate sensor protein UhpC-like MFS transporter|nr:MFS transporter [Tepidisphaeraceae bacterium]